MLGRSHLEPTDTQAKLAASEGSRLFQILAEPPSQGIEFLCIRTGDCCTCYGLEDSLFNAAVFVFSANNKPDVFRFFQWIMALKDKAFIFGLHESESSWNTRQNCAHPSPYDLLQNLDKRDFLLIERRILGDGKNNLRGVPLVQLSGDVVYEKPVAGNWKTILRVEILEVSELARELMTQTRIGDHLPVAITLVALHECCNQ